MRHRMLLVNVLDGCLTKYQAAHNHMSIIRCIKQISCGYVDYVQ